MPLFDHFHGQLAWRPWQSFHFQWCTCIAAYLNRTLPKQFIADAPMRLGSDVEADVVEYEVRNGGGQSSGASVNGGIAIATEPLAAVETVAYTPPVTDLTMPAEFPPELFVEVKDVTKQYRVVAIVELVSPGNKKEKNEREQFAAKCLSYLGEGIGLVIVDIVTERHSNLHNDLVHLAGHDDKFLMLDDEWIYATAYRPVHRNKEDLIDLWRWPMAVGSPLPTVPLALKGYGCVRLDLEASYMEACGRLRIPG